MIQFIRKHYLYANYLFRHKWYVGVECFKRGLYLQAFIHDWSKFLPSEWLPYAGFFNGEKTLEVKERFWQAWNAHQNRQPHHWQHWVVISDDGTNLTKKVRALRMPRKYVLEMVADWIGAGKAQRVDGTVQDWYLSKKDGILLHPESRKEVEAELGL